MMTTHAQQRIKKAKAKAQEDFERARHEEM
jgi:hypothetical protein